MFLCQKKLLLLIFVAIRKKILIFKHLTIIKVVKINQLLQTLQNLKFQLKKSIFLNCIIIVIVKLFLNLLRVSYSVFNAKLIFMKLPERESM